MKIGVALAITVGLLMACSASADIGWFAKWRDAPVGLRVNLSALPQSERAPFLAAMNSWNASPVVEFVEGNAAKVKVEVSTRCDPACSVPKKSGNGQLNGITLFFHPSIFSWGDRQWVYCHELGHALGLGEGYPSATTGDSGSCMAGEGMNPSEMDFAVLAEMYA